MKKITLVSAFFIAAIVVQSGASAQGFLKKIKDKANQVADKAINKKVDDKLGTGQDQNSNSTGNTGSTNQSGRPTNKGGEGLKNSTPPDVNQQIADAEKAHDAGNFSEARYSIQQALLGLEIQIGQEILRSLPAAVGDVPKDTAQDRVMSTQWGWANLTIQRIYRKDDKQLTVNIGNNPLYSGMLDMYFNNAYATQSIGENQNMKQVKVKGYKAAIKYDKNDGYTLLVPLGQSGMITWQGINYATEQDIMTAVNVFDIDGVKKKLGEK